MLDLSASCLDMLIGQKVRNIMLIQPDSDNSNFSDLLQGKEFWVLSLTLKTDHGQKPPPFLIFNIINPTENGFNGGS